MEPIRWCETHNCQAAHDYCLLTVGASPSWRAASLCSFILLVHSRDGSGRLLGLLAADGCENCGGTGLMPINRNCPKCGGSGWTLRAETKPRSTGWPPIPTGTVTGLPVERNAT